MQQQDVTLLCGLLRRRGDTEARNADDTAQDSDDVLEHAALRLWKVLQSSSDDTAAHALLHVDQKAWSRIAWLLFASSSGVVCAIVAVVCALASSPPQCSVYEPHADAGGAANRGAGGLVETTAERQPQSIHERIWRSEWWQRIVAKVEECYSVCLSQQTTSHQQQPLRPLSSEKRTKDVEICVRLLRVISAVLRHQASFIRTADGDDGAGREDKEDRARMNEGVALFVSLCTSPVQRIAICASTNILSLLQGSGESRVLMVSKLFNDSVVTVEFIAKWLRDSGVSPEYPVQRATRAKHEKDAKLQLQCVYFDLLVFAASSLSAEEIKWLVLDKVNPLQLSTQFLSHPHAELQERALNLLAAAVPHISSSPAVRQAKARVVCSNIRISGLLITVCWFMGHSHPGVAQAAGRLMDAVIANSPAADILRALVEQGCAVILSTLVSMALELREPHPQPSHDTSQSSRVLDWMAMEIASEQVLGAAMSSVLRSSNVLLEKNVLLSLLLLSQRGAKLKDLLKDEEDFLDEVVQVAIGTNEDGTLAAMLLAAALSWCDKCSVLKLEDSGSSFRLNKSGKNLRDATDEAIVSDNIPPVIKLTHKNAAIIAEVDGVLLYNLSKLVQKWIETMPSKPQIPLNQFQVSTIQLFADVLPKSQREAVIVLKHKDFPALSELLELTKYLGCSKCWHFATFAMNHTLSRSNWFSVFEFAIKIRHPSLMLRAGKMALECFEEETTDGNSTDYDVLLQASDSSCGSTPMQRFPELKTAAFQMFREVFQAETKPKCDPEV